MFKTESLLLKTHASDVIAQSSQVEVGLPSISVVIPTRDRVEDLTSLLQTLLQQTYSPKEVIIVDDSDPSNSAKGIAHFFNPQFSSINCKLKYVKGSSEGLTKSRNVGITFSESDVVFFADDDILLFPQVLHGIASFFSENKLALGIQPKIISTKAPQSLSVNERLENIFYRIFMLNYFKKNTLSVQRSGLSVFPSESTEVFLAKRLSGCCFCFRRAVFVEQIFDNNLKRYGFMEDQDFSYRLYKKYPNSLYVLPWPEILHKTSDVARLPSKLSTQMKTIYWFYVFFKDVLDGSLKNLLAFSWALTGNVALTILSLVSKRKNKKAWWILIDLLGSYKLAFKNLKSLLSGQLEFFDRFIQGDSKDR